MVQLCVLLFLLCESSSEAFAQNEYNIWYFGARTGLDFNNPAAKLLTNSALNSAESSCSISSPSGQLLFYTDGETVFNRRHLAMPNGIGLFGHRSSANGVAIVSDPAVRTRYYLFTVDQAGYAGPNRGLHYSVVDMQGDGGLGDVTVKNIHLLDSTSEHLGVVSGCQDSSYWIITHKMMSNAFYVWRLDKNGVNPIPVISSVGASLGSGFMMNPLDGVGRLAIAPSGRLLAVSHNNFVGTNSGEIFRFNTATGEISTPISITHDKYSYGVAFSKNSERVYFAHRGVICHYSLKELDQETILQSKQELQRESDLGAALQLASDGSIYVRSRRKLGRILNCDSPTPLYVSSLFDLGPDNEEFIGLPTVPVIVDPSSDKLVIAPRQFDIISSCEADTSYVVISNASCASKIVLSLRLSSGSISAFDTAGYLPAVLDAGDSLIIPITFNPLTQDGMHQVELFLHGVIGELSKGVEFDTSITLFANANAVPPRLSSTSNAMMFRSQSICFTRDTTITLTNTGCDTLTLNNVNGTGGAYSFSNVDVPMKLAPGESVSVTVTFHPSTLGNHFGNLQLTSTQQGITKKMDIPLSGVGTPGEGLLALQSASDVKLPELSICAAGDDTLATLRNTGCAPIIVKNVAITGPADYTLASTINNVTLAPDSTISFRISFSPKDKGARNASVTVTWTDISGNNPKDIRIALSANVIDGNKVLASSLNQINFGETNICEERDSVIRLTNNGCDTLTITGADVDKNFSVRGNYPIVLLPGQSIDVLITTKVDTAGKPTTLTGTLSITSTADNQIAPITLTRELYYPTKLRIEAVDEASGRQGDVVKFRVLLEGQVPATMSALHFDFLHNADLLSWEQYGGIGLTRTNIVGSENERASFTLSPVHDGVIGEFTFRTNLALSEQTTLSFDNIHFDAAGVTFAPECIAVISDSGSRFNYIYTCGDNIIRDRLNGTRLIKSITPNPARDEILLELNATDAQVAITDVLGAEVLRTSSADRIDVSNLPSGTYYVRVSTPDDAQTKRVIIQR